MAWGNNPFTSYTSGQNTWGTGQQQNPWSQNSGQFNPQAMNFGQGGQGGGYSPQPYSWQGQDYSGGMMGQGSQGGSYGQMPSWMQNVYGGMRGNMGGGGMQMPSWMNAQSGPIGYGQRQTMPASNGFTTDPTAEGYGGQSGGNLGLSAPAMGQAGGQATPAQAASSPYGMFANVVHNGVADSGGQNAVPALMAKMLYGSTPPGGNNNMSYNPMTGQWS